MASGVNGNSLEGFFKVTVQQWGTTGEDDCLWNIAKGVLQEKGIENPTAQQINETMNSIIQNQNELSDRKLEKDSIIYTGEQILVPLEDAIDGIENKVNTMTSEYNTLKGQIDSYHQNLIGMNLNVCFKKQAYDNAYTEFDRLDKQLPTGITAELKKKAEANMNKAKDEYESALEELEKHKEKIDNAENDLVEMGQEINTFKENLKQYVNEYDETENKIDEDLKEVAGYITDIEDEILEEQDRLKELYDQLDKINVENDLTKTNEEQEAYSDAQEYLYNGAQDGVLDKENKNAKVSIPDEFASVDAIDSFIYSEKGVYRDYIESLSGVAFQKWTIKFKNGETVTYVQDGDKLVLEGSNKTKDSKSGSGSDSTSNWTGYYKDPTTGEQRADVDSVKTSGVGGQYMEISYKDGTSVTIDKQTGTVTGTGLDKFNAAASGKAAEGSGDNNTSTTNTSGEYAELIKACASSGADKNKNIVNELKNIVNDNDKTFSEILENLDDTQKKAVATALSNVLDDPSNVGDEDKILINNIQDEINGENGTGSVTSFINDKEYKDNKSGLTLAEKWQRYNCCKYFDDDNFSTFVENSGNSDLSKDKIAASTDTDDFRSVLDLYEDYNKYNDYMDVYSNLYSKYSEYAIDNPNNEDVNAIQENYNPGHYSDSNYGDFDRYDGGMLNGTDPYNQNKKYNADQFIKMCDEMLKLLGYESIEEFKQAQS